MYVHRLILDVQDLSQKVGQPSKPGTSFCAYYVPGEYNPCFYG